jgi:hypothetical protein
MSDTIIQPTIQQQQAAIKAAAAMNVKSYAKLVVGTGPAAETVKVWGTVGTLIFLGMIPEVDGLLGASGKDKVVTRKNHKRSRWLGDRIKSTVTGGQAIYQIYPSRRGSALPGSPVKIVDLTNKTASGNRPQYTVQVDGNIGSFIEWWCDQLHPFEAKIIGPTGARYFGVTEKAAATP